MFQSVKALYKKEILDIFRDKKTMLVMVLVPILLYPLLFLGATYVASMVLTNQEQATYNIAFGPMEEEEEIREIMEQAEEDEGYLFCIVKTKQWEKDLKDKKIHAYITRKVKEEQKVYEIHYLSNVSGSVTGAQRMQEVLGKYREQLRIERLEEQGLDVSALLYPLEQELVDCATEQESFGSMIGMLVPFLMIVSILMGAIYAAIDVTAGEKERGTLETLLTLPVSNFSLIISKFFAVSTIAALSALLNFVSMGIIGVFLYQSFSPGSQSGAEIQWHSFLVAIILVIVCVLVFAMFLSALCMCICIFTKSFKEAQNYSTPLLIVVMLTGYLGFLPNIELNSVYAVIPVANIVLLVKDIFSFQYNFSNLFLVLITNIVYSFLAVWLMSKMYNSEKILFGEGGTLKLFERRANMKKGQMPGLGDACLLLAVSVLLMFYVGGVATMRLGFWGILVQQMCFLILPLVFAWYIKSDGKVLFSLGKPGIRGIFGSLFLWAGCYALMTGFSTVLSKWFPGDVKGLEEQAKMFLEQPKWALVLMVAVCPAICEEVLFRGFLFGTMKDKWRPWKAIVVSGLIFGIYHMSVLKAILISFLGMALAYSVYCTKSIFCSVLMHLCNNTVAVLAMLYPERIEKVLDIFMAEGMGETTVLFLLLVLGAAGVMAGICLLKKEKTSNEQAPVCRL